MSIQQDGCMIMKLKYAFSAIPRSLPPFGSIIVASKSLINHFFEQLFILMLKFQNFSFLIFLGIIGVEVYFVIIAQMKG